MRQDVDLSDQGLEDLIAHLELRNEANQLLGLKSEGEWFFSGLITGCAKCVFPGVQQNYRKERIEETINANNFKHNVLMAFVFFFKLKVSK